MTARVFNFSAGPAALPLEVLQQIDAELFDWRGSGMSVMEVSHRGQDFMAAAQEAVSDLRQLLSIPANYRVLFLQGGAFGQFAAVPMNLATSGDTVDYVITGSWSAKAASEAKRYCKVSIAADSVDSGHTTVTPVQEWRLSAGARYLHITPNETIGGVEFGFVPSCAAPIVADLSSTILSRPIDVSRYGLIYAGAQKNIGPAGITLVIVRDDLLGRARDLTPPTWNYATMAAAGSMLNTPPTFAWYVAGLVFKWILRQGGLSAMAERNRAKAELLYQTIDESGFYRNPVDKAWRSWMNVPFLLPSTDLEPQFLREAKAAGLENLAGHRSVGGMRASLYNAMGIDGVRALTTFMRQFAREHG